MKLRKPTPAKTETGRVIQLAVVLFIIILICTYFFTPGEFHNSGDTQPLEAETSETQSK